MGSRSRQEPGMPESTFELPKRSERATGIEPAFSAWEADVLPLYDARWGNAPLGPNVSRASPELSGEPIGTHKPGPTTQSGGKVASKASKNCLSAV